MPNPEDQQGLLFASAMLLGFFLGLALCAFLAWAGQHITIQ